MKHSFFALIAVLLISACSEPARQFNISKKLSFYYSHHRDTIHFDSLAVLEIRDHDNLNDYSVPEQLENRPVKGDIIS